MAKLNSLQDLGQHVRPVSVIRSDLLSFLARYQKENPGQTPTIDCMINELGDSEDLIRTALAALESRGEIHIISRFPLRISLTGSGLEHANHLAPLPEDPDRSRRFLEADGMRHQLGRFIGQIWRDKNRGPSLREMMEHISYNHPGYVTRMVEILAEKGLVQFGRGVPTRLTEFGARFYGFEQQQKKEAPMSTPASEGPRPVIVFKKPRSRKMARWIVNSFCHAIASLKRQGTPTTAANVCAQLGLSPRSVSEMTYRGREACRLGYLEPKAGRNRQFEFTEKGYKKFWPEGLQSITAALKTREDTVSEIERGEAPVPDQIEITTLSDQERVFEPSIGSGTGRMTRVADIPTADLVLELVERGYNVRKN